MKSTLDFHPKFLASLASYSKEKFTKDLMAGIIVGIVALPLAIAFGIASGVSPEKGLITAIIGGFIVSFLGGNSVQIGGPTGAFIVIVYGIIQAYGLEGLAIATFMAGLILVLMGCFRLGTIIKFIPYPIVVGFTSGIALTIFATQIKDLLGLSMDSVPADFISKWVAYFQHIETTNFWSLGIGILSILIIAYTPRISNKIPGSLMAIILMTVLVYVLERLWGIEGIETMPCSIFRDRRRIPVVFFVDTLPFFVIIRSRCKLPRSIILRIGRIAADNQCNGILPIQVETQSIDRVTTLPAHQRKQTRIRFHHIVQHFHDCSFLLPFIAPRQRSGCFPVVPSDD